MRRCCRAAGETRGHARSRARESDGANSRDTEAEDRASIESELAAFRASLRASTRDAPGVLSSILTSPIVLDLLDGRFEAAATFESFADGVVVGMPEAPSFIPRDDRRGHAIDSNSKFAI